MTAIASARRPSAESLDQLAAQSVEFSQAIAGLLVRVRAGTPAASPATTSSAADSDAATHSSRRSGGRPSLASRVSKSDLAAAPFAELLIEPADRLTKRIRGMTDVDLLERGHAFLLTRENAMARASVLDALEARLRQLGRPLGGPRCPPVPEYEQMLEHDVMRMLASRNDSEFVANVYAWEAYRMRRRKILNGCLAIDAPACKARYSETSPRTPKPPEPFAGYDGLSASPNARQRTRATLAAQTPQTLHQALDYERKTKNRVVMIQHIEVTLRAQR